jgi:hypothetical protein
MGKHIISKEDENTLLEELASYLNDYYSDKGLEITINYEKSSARLSCYNYLTEEEQKDLEEVAMNWLQKKLRPDKIREISISKKNHSFNLSF